MLFIHSLNVHCHITSLSPQQLSMHTIKWWSKWRKSIYIFSKITDTSYKLAPWVRNAHHLSTKSICTLVSKIVEMKRKFLMTWKWTYQSFRHLPARDLQPFYLYLIVHRRIWKQSEANKCMVDFQRRKQWPSVTYSNRIFFGSHLNSSAHWKTKLDNFSNLPICTANGCLRRLVWIRNSISLLFSGFLDDVVVLRFAIAFCLATCAPCGEEKSQFILIY